MRAKRRLYAPLTALLVALIAALTGVMLPALARPTYAHAVIVRSEPAANARLDEPPHEIRLWFTEPLEASYSSIELRDASGNVISTPPSYIEPSDDHQMVLMTGELPEGLYTVVWRNVSSADGHRQTGSFPFVIGAASTDGVTASVEAVDLETFDLLARWVNFWGLALAAGTIAFIVFVWQPATRELGALMPRASWVPGSMWSMVWLGWIAAGVGAALLLVNQTAILLDQSPRDALVLNQLTDVITSTRFGTLWLWRLGLWLALAVLLVIARRSRVAAWLAAACALLMLLPMSMHSHAAVSSDIALSVFSDWVHLTMCALWVGGLVQFLVAIPALRRLLRNVTPAEGGRSLAGNVGLLVAHFSNVARIAVVGLIITGVYATWLQVTTLEALTTTLYGQLLSFKLLLALPLLAVAGVNLLWTQSRLLAGRAIWVGRLRLLIGLEVALLFGILLVVGGMTAINPARNEIAQREAAAAIPPAPQPQPIHVVEDVDDLQIHFTATPGWVGNSTFAIQLVNKDGEPVTDASLIRLRFQHRTENLGESELQIRPETEATDGVYSVDGANLSTVGDWRLRLTVQRPGEFDAVADMEFNVIAPPPPPPAPVVDLDPVLPNRTPILLTIGFLATLLGAFFVIRERVHFWQGAGIMGALLGLLGLACIVSSFMTKV